MTQSQYFLNYSREIDVKWQQNSVIITKLHHIHLPAIRNRNHSNFCQECLLIDERLFYIQMVNINDIDFRGFYHKCTKNNFWMLMKLFLAQLHIKGWLLRMMSSTRSLVPVHFLVATDRENDATVTKFWKAQVSSSEVCPSLPQPFITVEVLCQCIWRIGPKVIKNSTTPFIYNFSPCL